LGDVRFAWLWVALPIAFQLTNGCAAPSAGQDIQINVVAMRTEAGNCFVGAHNASQACHIIQVRVTNRERYNSSALDASHWTAIDKAGRLWRNPFVEDGRALAPGAERTTQLGFTLPTGTNLVRLDWSGYSQTISIPLSGA
jgi:hypothetical protein